MNRSAKALAIGLVATAVLGIYYYLEIIPTTGFQVQSAISYAMFFFILVGSIVWAARLTPIQMVDPMKQQLGIQQTTESINPNFEAPYCLNCGFSLGTSKFCPQCGTFAAADKLEETPILNQKVDELRERPNLNPEEDDFPEIAPGPEPESEPEITPKTFKDKRTTLVDVTIEGTAQVPQGQLQNMVITKVKMGRGARATTTTAPPKPVRSKIVKPETIAPQIPDDDSPMEKDVFR